MIREIGNQKREPIEETEYLIDFIDQHTVIGEQSIRSADWPGPREAILINTATDKKEKWVENDDYAGYVIEIGGVGFEFVCEQIEFLEDQQPCETCRKCGKNICGNDIANCSCYEPE